MDILYLILLVVIIGWLIRESINGVQKMFARLVLLLFALGFGLGVSGAISYDAGNAITWCSVVVLMVMIVLRSRSIIDGVKELIKEIEEDK